MDSRLHDEASNVEAEGGEIQVNGPDGVAVSLTPDAAEETGRRLIEKARVARLQTDAEPDDLLPDELDDNSNFA